MSMLPLEVQIHILSFLAEKPFDLFNSLYNKKLVYTYSYNGVDIKKVYKRQIIKFYANPDNNKCGKGYPNPDMCYLDACQNFTIENPKIRKTISYARYLPDFKRFYSSDGTFIYNCYVLFSLEETVRQCNYQFDNYMSDDIIDLADKYEPEIRRKKKKKNKGSNKKKRSTKRNKSIKKNKVLLDSTIDEDFWYYYYEYNWHDHIFCCTTDSDYWSD